MSYINLKNTFFRGYNADVNQVNRKLQRQINATMLVNSLGN